MPRFEVWVNTYFNTSTRYEVEAANEEEAEVAAMELAENIEPDALFKDASWSHDEVLAVEEVE
jgi:hypothetical protein